MSYENKKKKIEGVLYIVSTPIGNMGDITLRAIETLKSVDCIFAEDTRICKKLLSQHDIKFPELISCHKYNEENCLKKIIKKIENNKKIAITSDSGTPLICDPGTLICNKLREANYKIIPIPGVNAAITALSAAGINPTPFVFRGFLPSQVGEKRTCLESIKNSKMTNIFYESKHRILKSLKVIDQVFGSRKIVIAKELTKRNENFLTGNAKEILVILESEKKLCKGEFVILIKGSNLKEIDNKDVIKIDTSTLLKILMDELSLKKTIELSLKITKDKKNNLYEKALKIKKVGF